MGDVFEVEVRVFEDGALKVGEADFGAVGLPDELEEEAPRSDVAPGVRIKGAEGFMDQGPPGPPPPAPRLLRPSDAMAVLHWLDREARF